MAPVHSHGQRVQRAGDVQPVQNQIVHTINGQSYERTQFHLDEGVPKYEENDVKNAIRKCAADCLDNR